MLYFLFFREGFNVCVVLILHGKEYQMNLADNERNNHKRTRISVYGLLSELNTGKTSRKKLS